MDLIRILSFKIWDVAVGIKPVGSFLNLYPNSGAIWHVSSSPSLQRVSGEIFFAIIILG